jgi:hypothetical protein
LLFFLLVAVFSIYLHKPPAPSAPDAPAEQFSAGRAMSYLHEIAQKPRPVGSQEHSRVGQFIYKELSGLGLSPETQKAVSVNPINDYLIAGATVENIIARLEGINNSRAVMLVAHYDSVPTGPGAADNGAGVAILLEALRALKSGPPLQNDVIFLFTDAEENGLLGARAFAKDHAWAKDVGVVLNFEARGTAGPSLMFETSNQNGWLVREFARAAPSPVANSLMYDLYKLLPNDTDLTVFRRAGMPGFNFAFTQGAARYHTAMDRVEDLEGGSLQHQGSYAVVLARWFGNLHLQDERQPDAVYFNLLTLTLVTYTKSCMMLFTALTTALLVVVFMAAYRNSHLTFMRVALGFLAFVGSLVATFLVVTAGWWLAEAVNSEYRWMRIDTYNSTLYLLAFSALTIAVVSLILGLVRRIGLPALWMGAMLFWFILMVLSSLLLPGGSFLFTWPLLFSLLAFAVLFASKEDRAGSNKSLALAAILTAPCVILYGPILVIIFYGLTVRAAAIVMVLLALLLGLLMMPLTLLEQRNRWALPVGMTIVCLIFLTWGSMTAEFAPNYPRPDHLFYFLDQDTGQAVWASLDESPSEWTSQFLNNHGGRTRLDKLLPSSPRTFITSPGTVISLPPPEILLLEDSSDDNIRKLRIKVLSPRRAPIAAIHVLPGASVRGYSIDGESIEVSSNGTAPPQAWQFNYAGLPAEGVELTLQLNSTEGVEIRVTDQSYGLPDVPGKETRQWPEAVIRSPYYLSDTTVITRSFKF